ncbi:aldo/keto reductase [Fusobacterium simiae]|uniref:Aldo/keto reductase n=1 Tax=Fusobacterium simiae TaxID=855 RepID=A0ABT4DM39_FUSSI|nr:aldo/keto reductase [Fusobacterium simiae]MCY7009048.1 aldo/keto reductase [Fusobacterium simiae]
MEYIKLNDGHKIPVLGFGTFQIPADGSTYKAVLEALKIGYRHIDTAVAYFNEQEVGKAIKDSGIPREEIFVTSKLWLQDFGYESAKKAIEKSLSKLNLDYIDLYLIHQPYGDVPGAWKAMEEAKEAGKIKSIGVSNMTPTIWNSFVPQFKIMPVVNQVEFNPYFQQKELRKILNKNKVVLEAWAPLGQGNAELLKEEVFTKLAKKYNKNNGQIIIRWVIQEGVVTFPKSTNPERIKSNLDVFDFKLTEDEMSEIRALDKGKGRWNPDTPGAGEMLLNAYDVHADEK